ncbi:MAG: hypothetical protein AAF962_15665 [Actinomycetota bacterium]
MSEPQIEISLEAVIVAVTDDQPRLLTVDGPDGRPALPAGLLEAHDPTLELGLRRWVQDQTGLEVGYVEQLYTFGDRVRGASAPAGPSVGSPSARELSIAYLALVREGRPSVGAAWLDFYQVFPWEDHRNGRPAVLDSHVDPALHRYVDAGGALAEQRAERARIVFGPEGGSGASFDGVRVLERYELLYELGLLAESEHGPSGPAEVLPQSRAMFLDHRRIAATALTRLRGKLTYRPVVFELLPDRFTLSQLQRVVEALSGVGLHKQNFRRMVEAAGLVEGTAELTRTGGRPAELFRFRREVLGERPRPGVGTPWIRA